MSVCNRFSIWILNFFYVPERTQQLELRTLGAIGVLEQTWETDLSRSVQSQTLLPCLQANCNLICGDEYGPETRMSMAQLNEKETSFELIEALLKYIETLNVPGAVLVFLPGWNLIYTMQKYLEMNPHFGMSL